MQNNGAWTQSHAVVGEMDRNLTDRKLLLKARI
jgi:hypothetical protein